MECVTAFLPAIRFGKALVSPPIISSLEVCNPKHGFLATRFAISSRTSAHIPRKQQLHLSLSLMKVTVGRQDPFEYFVVILSLCASDSPTIPCVAKLSGTVSSDLAANWTRIRIVRCERPAKCQKHKRCETKARFLPPLLHVGAICVTTKCCDSCAQGAL